MTPGPFFQVRPHVATQIGMGDFSHMILSVIDHPIRIRFSGTDPTSTVGRLLPVGVHEFYNLPCDIRIIDTIEGPSICDIQLLR